MNNNNQSTDKEIDFVLCGDKKKHLKIPEGYKLVTDRNVTIQEGNIHNYKVANIVYFH